MSTVAVLTDFVDTGAGVAGVPGTDAGAGVGLLGPGLGPGLGAGEVPGFPLVPSMSHAQGV